MCPLYPTKMPEGALTTVLTTEAALALALVAPWRDARGVLPAMDAEDLCALLNGSVEDTFYNRKMFVTRESGFLPINL